MKKISFTTKSLIDGSEIIGPVPTDDKYTLLALFVGTNFVWDEIISDLESVSNGEKTFSDIHDPRVVWGFGLDGEFECDKDTAYFYSEKEPSLNLEIPLSELIDLLKEWNIFLETE